MGAWRVLPLETGPPEELLAEGVRLLERLADDPVPTLRWYRSTATAIVLGRGQRRTLELGPDHPPVLKRHSGGGAVLLTPDFLALDIALPAGHPLLDGDLSSVFLPVGRAWREGLERLGAPGLTVHTGPAEANRRGDARERLLADICYATLGRGEVLARGRKLVGLSQRRRRPGALVQCGLLRRWKPAPLLAALGADPLDGEIARAAIGLDELVADPPADAAIVRVVSERLTR